MSVYRHSLCLRALLRAPKHTMPGSCPQPFGYGTEKEDKSKHVFFWDSLCFNWCLQPEGCSLPLIHAGEQRRGKLWALLQKQKELPGFIVPQTASTTALRDSEEKHTWVHLRGFAATVFPMEHPPTLQNAISP